MQQLAYAEGNQTAPDEAFDEAERRQADEPGYIRGAAAQRHAGQCWGQPQAHFVMPEVDFLG
ncbi:hypothetical protein D9M71_477070 [compost metagenome]